MLQEFATNTPLSERLLASYDLSCEEERRRQQALEESRSVYNSSTTTSLEHIQTQIASMEEEEEEEEEEHTSDKPTLYSSSFDKKSEPVGALWKLPVFYSFKVPAVEKIERGLWGEFDTPKPCPSPCRLNTNISHIKLPPAPEKYIRTAVAHDELLEYRLALVRVAQEKFLDGKDAPEFTDYAAIDNDETLDNLDIIGQDEEDRYFDDEEPDS